MISSSFQLENLCIMSEFIIYSVFSLVIITFLYGIVIIILNTLKISQIHRSTLEKLKEENRIMLIKLTPKLKHESKELQPFY